MLRQKLAGLQAERAIVGSFGYALVLLTLKHRAPRDDFRARDVRTREGRDDLVRRVGVGRAGHCDRSPH